MNECSFDKYEQRYYSKRAAGISPIRKDGSVATPQNDKQSGNAEEFAANQFGSPVNDDVLSTGDDGCDFYIKVKVPSGKVRKIGVEAVWMGNKKDGTPRTEGNLLVNPFEPHRYRNSDIFVLVSGSVETGFKLEGWETKKDIELVKPKNFNYGPRYYKNRRDLKSMQSLFSMVVS